MKFRHVIGAGDVADPSVPIEQCVATLAYALDRGVHVVDTAPNYENGLSERVAVRERRDDAFVIDKIDDLLAPVGPQIDASLSRLGLPYADAFVFHSLSSMAIFEELMKRGGGFDQLGECVAAGKARYRGISSHHPDVMRAAIEAGVCDIGMFPVGPFVDARYVDEILPLAKSRGVASVCFKTFGAGKLVADTSGYNAPLEGRANLPRLTIAECLHYTLTLAPDVALLGMSTVEEMEAAFEAHSTFAPLTDAQMADIRARAVEARRDKGPCWWNPDPSM